MRVLGASGRILRLFEETAKSLRLSKSIIPSDAPQAACATLPRGSVVMSLRDEPSSADGRRFAPPCSRGWASWARHFGRWAARPLALTALLRLVEGRVSGR